MLNLVSKVKKRRLISIELKNYILLDRWCLSIIGGKIALGYSGVETESMMAVIQAYKNRDVQESEADLANYTKR